jgi:hypothetical protein
MIDSWSDRADSPLSSRSIQLAHDRRCSSVGALAFVDTRQSPATREGARAISAIATIAPSDSPPRANTGGSVSSRRST